MVASDTFTLADPASVCSCSALTCRCGPPNSNSARATRWRVGLRPAMRKTAVRQGLRDGWCRLAALRSDIGPAILVIRVRKIQLSYSDTGHKRQARAALRPRAVLDPPDAPLYETMLEQKRGRVNGRAAERLWI